MTRGADLDALLAEMAGYLGFSVEALKGKSRQRPLVAARQIAMYVFRDMTELSYPAIARLFGGRDGSLLLPKCGAAHATPAALGSPAPASILFVFSDLRRSVNRAGLV